MPPQLLSKIYKILYRAVFPPKCLVCRNFFDAPEVGDYPAAGAAEGRKQGRLMSLQCQIDRLMPQWLCPVCIRGLTVVESPICSCCGLPFKSRQGADHLCGDCITSPKKFRMARAPLAYERILTEIIHCFKYKGKIQLADSLAELLLTAFGLFWDPERIDVIMPVPLHIQRMRQRGFNQSYLLIRNWNTLAGSYFSSPPGFRIERDILARTVATTPQAALGRSRRATNLKNAFELKGRDAIKDKRILLVDDVYTTGSTVQECTEVLLDQGAQQVDILTLARAV
jgi:ComF family protein